MSVPGISWAVSSYLSVCPDLREKILDGVRMREGEGGCQERKGRAAKALGKPLVTLDPQQGRLLEMITFRHRNFWAVLSGETRGCSPGVQRGCRASAGQGLWEVGSESESGSAGWLGALAIASPVASVMNL